ncbi:unnamed protein product [Rhizoctonia solani]|uniref:Protein kinase domain-containing protein n=1 Tax=Rhizoctonia solani TaxID=456999 RepID=A0A8H3BJ80_9AGAM|nr:unnamed protein product [Rhizoctonia solani]
MVMEGKHPERPMDIIPETKAGNLLWDLLSACWSYDPKERPSAKEVNGVINALAYPQTSSSTKFRELGIEDIAARFRQKNVADYTNELGQINLRGLEPYLHNGASATLYKIELSIKWEEGYARYPQQVIVKYIDRGTPDKQLKRATRELETWAPCNHRNILTLLGFAALNGRLAMISSWMKNGPVTDYVKSQRNPDYYDLCTQLSSAIKYLHSIGIVHGDIKGDNALVSDRGVVKVMDFGVSIREKMVIEYTQTATGRGTERWQAPEILSGKTDSTKEGDVYAMAMTMIEIYTHDRPYGNMHIGHNERSQIIAGTLRPLKNHPLRLPHDKRGKSLWSIWGLCWVGDPAGRVTSDDVYEWLSNIEP